ncbi:urea ABC transporter ATP-binding subunit UrtE [soil metagenome]
MLRINNLQVNYGESSILRDVSMDVPAGQVVCLMGRNGVGKTTLMKSIMGLLKSRQGHIYMDEQEMTQWPASRRARAGIGYVPQGRGIFPYLTVYENLLMGFEALPDQKVDKEALDEVYTIFPVLKQMGKRVAGTLSGGQQQQLSFGRVLVRRPKLLLLDEPTEGIQPSIMTEIEELILALRKQGEMSILLVEQFLDFALNVGNYFYIMETGSIVMQGGVEQFNADAAREYLAV